MHCNVTKREFMAHATKYDRKIAVKCMALKSPKRDESFASDMCFPSAWLFFFYHLRSSTSSKSNATKTNKQRKCSKSITFMGNNYWAGLLLLLLLLFLLILLFSIRFFFWLHPKNWLCVFILAYLEGVEEK